jgi:hypothetical protein
MYFDMRLYVQIIEEYMEEVMNFELLREESFEVSELEETLLAAVRPEEA